MFNFLSKIDSKVFPGMQHDEYAENALKNARREFLLACDQMEHWEAMKNYRAKQIERLEKYVQENNPRGSASLTSKYVSTNDYILPRHNPIPDGGK